MPLRGWATSRVQFLRRFVRSRIAIQNRELHELKLRLRISTPIDERLVTGSDWADDGVQRRIVNDEDRSIPASLTEGDDAPTPAARPASQDFCGLGPCGKDLPHSADCAPRIISDISLQNVTSCAHCTRWRAVVHCCRVHDVTARKSQGFTDLTLTRRLSPSTVRMRWVFGPKRGSNGPLSSRCFGRNSRTCGSEKRLRRDR
jgi:hypothetical protein